MTMTEANELEAQLSVLSGTQLWSLTCCSLENDDFIGRLLVHMFLFHLVQTSDSRNRTRVVRVFLLWTVNVTRLPAADVSPVKRCCGFKKVWAGSSSEASQTRLQGSVALPPHLI